MKISISLFLFILILCGCKEKEGIIVSTNGTQLRSIDKFGKDRLFEEYLYDEQNRLIAKTRGNPANYRWSIIYEEEVVKEIVQEDLLTDTPTRRDSFLYDSQMRVSSVNSYTYIDGGSIEQLNGTTELDYDGEGQVSQAKNFSPSTGNYISQYSYIWLGGNVISTTYQNGEGVTQYVTTYEYDDKKNYTLGNPLFLKNPAENTLNNKVYQITQDFSGLFDPICNPCTTDYKYNLDDFPVEIKRQWDEEKITLEYF